MIDKVNPHWRQWYNGLKKTDRTKVDKKLAEIEADPAIPANNRNTSYARMAALMDWCAAQLGYEKQG
jgi:hypothetical protein